MKIGWAHVDVTPDRPVILRGQFHVRVSKYVNDPLTCTILALEQDDQQAIMVSCDRVNMPYPLEAALREAVAKRLPGFDPRNLLMNATHTHTAAEVEEGIYPDQGPDVMSPTEYAGFFVERVTEAIGQAWESRAAGGVSWGYGHAVVGHNRRLCYQGGMAKMYGKSKQADFSHVEGYEDHGVDLLFTWDLDENLTGVIVNVACPSQVTEGESYVSADFWHEAREEIHRRLGDEVQVFAQCAAAGDQSPHLLLEQRSEELMRRRRGLTERQEIGRRIANAVEDVLPYVREEIFTHPSFAHVVRDVNLPTRLVTRADYDEAAAQVAHWEAQPADPSDTHGFSVRYMMLRRYGRVMTRYQTQQEDCLYQTEVHALRIGDVAIATNPFELFLDYGMRIKARSEAVQTFVVQLTGTGKNTMAGYLPTARAVAAKSYGAEAADNRVGPEGGQVLVDQTVDLINSLWETPAGR